ncbi:SpvB/TcaC N-terminal domain-containing protein [Kangiella sp.]|uniref:SpvB/TcaC N-terminal domain-containing protein n=1 Tax=Kangiella sp. TaxID=1920245 RepID=UPI0019B4BE97|nr:SpvB/TcaC N-terminal domain-containing protein [Kangiella sp.]MBD3654289.1 VCBS repeat-containing protein [Kangiella sp.]
MVNKKEPHNNNLNLLGFAEGIKMGMFSFRQYLAAILLLLTFQLVSLEAAHAEICWDPLSVDEPTGDDSLNKGKSGNNKKQNGKGKNADDGLSILNLCNNPTPSPATPSAPGTPSVSPTNSTNGAYQVSWSAASSMVTSGSNAWGYQLVEYRGGTYVKTYTTSPTTTSQSISGNPDGNYRYKVRGCNLDLNTGVPKCGSYSSLSTTNLVRNKPSTPSAPSVGSSTSTGSIAVSWTKPSGTVSFYRLQKRVNGGSWTWANTNVSSTNTTVSSLTDGSWDFRVQACNAYTWSCSSLSADSANSTVRVKPSVAAAPTISSSTSTGTVTVTWAKPSGTVTFYNLQKRNNSGGWSNVVTGFTGTSRSVSGLTDGSWDFRVQACNGYSWACSTHSADSANTTVRIIPSVATAPTISSSTSTGTVTVSWTKPSGTVSYYNLQKRNGSGSWTNVVTGFTGTSRSVSGLTDGSWDFRVQACNGYSWACSSYSTDSANTRVLVKPATPVVPTVSTSTSTGSVTVSWVKPSGTATYYNLQKRNNAGSWTNVATGLTGTSRSVSGLTDGSWDFRVQACNGASWSCSGYSSDSSNTTVRNKPSNATAPTISSSTSTGSVTVSWVKPSGTVTYYNLQKRNNAGSWTNVVTAFSGTSQSVSGLTDGSWDFRVQACNGYSWACSSLSSDSANVTVKVPPSTPSAPTLTSTTSTGTLTVSWIKPAGTVSYYNLQKRSNAGSWTSVATGITTTSSSVSGLTDGSWDFRVIACNGESWACSSASVDSSNVTVFQKPSNPSAPSVSTTTSKGSLGLSWAEPSGTVTYYNVQQRKDGSSWTALVNGYTGTSYSVLGLTDGVVEYRVQACNNQSWACTSYSASSEVVTVRVIPSAPTAPTINSSTNNGSITLSWTKPSGTVSFYRIQKRLGSGAWEWANSNVATTTTSISGLTEGSWTFRVQACNEFTWSCSVFSEVSNTTSTYLKPVTPAAPALSSSTSSTGSLMVSWVKPSGTVTYYNLQQRMDAGSWSTVRTNYASTSVNISGLTDGDWDFRVQACNNYSWACSSYSTDSSNITVTLPPSPPSSISVSGAVSLQSGVYEDFDGMHVISWGESTGSSITYELEERLKPYSEASYGLWAVAYNSTGRSKSFADRDDGDWEYRVRACNSSGCSAYLELNGRVKVLKPPYSPTNVNVPSTDDDGAYTLSWSNGGGIVERYEFVESPDYSPAVSVGTATSKVISGKGDGTWDYKVLACNSSGCSHYGFSNSVTVSHPTPSAPASITVPPQTAETSYQITWEASTSSSLDNYQVSQQHELNGWSAWTNVSGTSYQVTVDKSGDWTHRVRACNKLPDNTRKCSSAKTSSVVNVQLPAAWAKTGGNVIDQTYGYTETLTSDETVGAVEGSGGVSGGAAAYNIPIVIPPGRKGMQPNVSLNYSSRSGNGIAGVGWSLSAGSSIHRCSATYAQDGYSKGVTLSPEDKLCLDGQRLILVNGTYGQSGAEYRTELDSFSKITQLDGGINSGASFEVKHKNNRTSYYGDTSDSRHVPEGLAHPMTWGISKQEDSSGNRIDYIYQSYGDGEYHIKEILYTGSGSLQGNRKVSLEYEARTDISRSFNSGGLTLSTKRLKSIRTYVGSALVRTYNIAYLNSNFSNRSLLSSVQECASGKCLPATNFDVYHPSIQWDNNDSSSSTNQALSEIGEIGGNDWVGYKDLNGDGLPEVLYQSAEYDSLENLVGFITTIYSRDNATGNYTDVYTSDDTNSTVYPDGRNHGDLNGDGIVDFFVTDSSRRVSLNQFEEDDYGNFNLVNLGLTNITMPTSYESNREWGANTLQILDLNGDGYQDFLFIDNVNKVQAYFNKANGAMEFLGPYSIKTLSEYTYDTKDYREQISFRDVDGDGVIDLMRTWQNGVTSMVINIDFGRINLSGVWVSDETRNASQLNLPSNLFSNQHTFADINGDGLTDFVRPVETASGFDWRVRENLGNRAFSVEKSLGTSVGIHKNNFLNARGRISTRVQALWGGLRVADFDNDGVDELLVATGSSDDVCVNFFGNPNETGSDEPYSVKVCNDALHASHADLDSHQGTDIAIDWARYDTRRFNWDILDLKQTTQGPTIDRRIQNVVKAPLSSFMVLSGRSHKALELEDNDNNGTIDFNYKVATSYQQGGNVRVGGVMYYRASVSMSYQSTSPSFASGYFEQKNLMGLGADLGKLADTNYQVENGLGQKFQWSYAPLSRWLLDRTNGEPFYDVPKGNARYIANDPKKENFYFTSSMYVVSNSYQSNGIDSNFNETQYNYREAIYNRAGRGFQGFRSVIVDDLASGMRSVTDFHQIFPKAGKIQEVRTCLIGDSLFECQGSPLSKTVVNSYHEKNTLPNVYWVYPAETVKEDYDLNNRTTVLNHEKTIIGGTICSYASVGCDTDIYGNVLYKSVIKDNGFQKVGLTETKTYDYSYSDDWWINKIQSSSVTTTTIDQNFAVPIAAGTDVDQSSYSQYTYDSSGILHRIPTSTVTTASGTSQSHTTTVNLNTFGQPTTVTQQASGNTGSDLNRKVTTTYSADSYFPETVTNDKNHTTSTVISAKHGQPISVTDANGNTVNYTYDTFGRVKSITVPGGKPIETGYQWCYSSCPDTAAVYFEFTKQEGSPTVKTYKDMFNRTVMVETIGFDGSSIYTSVDYDKLGRKTFESTPSFYSSNTTGTRYNGYDVLGRLTNKETDRENSNTYYTTYSYSGHKTDITVTDGGNVLSMSRTYGGDGKLIQTTDAMGGVTRYAYDSMGNPITLQDANSNLIHAWHNGFGHKTKVDDPNMGVKTFVYNTFGEAEQEIDANGDTLIMQYDGLGRLTQRSVNGSAQATFTYDRVPKGLGLPASESATGIQKEFYYDEYSRPYRQVTTIDSTPYETITEYDNNFGRVKAVEYPGSGIKVGYAYNQYGYQTKTFNANSGFVYQEVTSRDHFLNAVETLKNAGTLAESRNYDTVTGQLKSIVASAGGVQKHFLDYWYGSFGNLAWQEVQYENGAKTSREDYSYDNLHRLTYSTRSFTGITHTEDPITYSYDQVGNLLVKTDYATTISYGGTGKANAGNAGPNAVLSITKPDGRTADYTYDNNGNMTSGDGKSISYNAFNKPISISKGGINSTFAYGADLMRFKQVKTGLPEGDETTIYLDKMVEIVKQGGSTITRTYIDDIAIVSKEEIVGQPLADHKIRFTLRDRLGSVVTLVDHNNIITEDRSYDPFGKPRTAGLMDVAPPTLSAVVGGEPFTNRGFTDHEHLDDAELIHMNGRAYDYNLGRFLSVDPFIQSPGNSQSMNPYSYIMNNPLAGTDPTGYTSVGNLGVTEEHCNFMCMTGMDKFTWAGDNGKRGQSKQELDREIAALGGQKNLEAYDWYQNHKRRVTVTPVSGGTSNYFDPPGNCQNTCTSRDFTDKEKEQIRTRINEMSADIINASYGSYDEAASALHNSGLVEYFDSLGIEGWAVISQDDFSIKEVGTGFSGAFAKGVYDKGHYSLGDAVWHTHPNGGDVWNGDWKSAMKNRASRIYASGRDLTYINAGLSSIGLPDKPIQSWQDWDNYTGYYEYTVHNLTTSKSFKKQEIKAFEKEKTGDSWYY